MKGHFNKHSKSFVTLLCFVLVILIGIFDYFVGPDFSSLIAYLIPVIFITRIAGRMAGILSSFASAASWILADILAEPEYVFRVSLFWSHIENLTIFLIIVYILLKLSQKDYSADCFLVSSTPAIASDNTQGKCRG